MTKLTYTNDEQLISDAAQMLIENHLMWSGSNNGMPSTDLEHVGNEIREAYLKANYTVEEWNNANKEEQYIAQENANFLYFMAMQMADRKWEEAKTLLGI